MSIESTFVASSSAFARRNAAGLKLMLVAFLVLVLLIPLAMVHDTLRERRDRHDGAIAEITQSWGRAQRLLGPVLVVPYSYQAETEERTSGGGAREKVIRTFNGEAFFLPEQLDVRGELEPSARRRGIYATDVYAAKLHLAGRFAPAGVGFTGVATAVPQWDRVRACFAISDLRGTRDALTLRWSGRDIPLQPGAMLEKLGPGLHALVPVAAGGETIDFSLDLTLNGSDALTVVPVGRQTTVRLSSPWKDPGFTGAFLPVQRRIDGNGFDATWQVSYYGRDFPQQWTDRPNAPAPAAATFEAAAFGVNLVHTITAYRTIERAIKYGVLFLSLVFATFFLFETVSGVRLSALNYLLVGAALCLFYLGLLALSEFIGFTAAYAGAAAASVLLIGAYGWSVLHRASRSLLVCAMLGGVYGYLYFVLQMEDFALLAGTAALFALLAAVMYATRRSDAIEPPPQAAPVAGTA
jgi:inner membrane protein